MAWQIDHVFILTDPGAPAADALADAGFIEGEGRVHEGQGTANRRFFFENGMLEFLWVADEAEAGRPPVARTELLERWQRSPRGSCPYGIALRWPGDELPPPPFETWDYRPSYVPPGVSIPIATGGSGLTCPLIFVMPAETPPSPKPDNHQRITRVSLTSPAPLHEGSPTAKLIDLGLLQWRHGTIWRLEIGLDGEATGRHCALTPDVPLVVGW